MKHANTVSPLHRAMKYQVARAMHHRRQALERLVSARGATSAAELAVDPDLMLLEAEHDQRVVSAIQAYRYAGGRVLDSSVDLPCDLYNDKPEANAALQAVFRFKNLPTDAARIDPEPDGWARCYFDRRYREPVLEFLGNYYRHDHCLLEVRVLPSDQWTVAELPTDEAAAEVLYQRDRTQQTELQPSL